MSTDLNLDNETDAQTKERYARYKKLMEEGSMDPGPPAPAAISNKLTTAGPREMGGGRKGKRGKKSKRRSGKKSKRGKKSKKSKKRSGKKRSGKKNRTKKY